LQPSDLGSARKATLSRTALTITGGASDRVAIAERTDLLRRRMARLSPTSEEWRRLQGRLAQLNGRSAILKLGAHGETERKHRRGQAEKALRVLTGMLVGGVVAGGGVAYLELAAALRVACEQCRCAGHEAGVDVFVSALEAPIRQIVANGSHVHPPLALAETRRRGCGVGFDVLSGHFVDMRQQGIVDSAEVVRGALQFATSTAISLLTTGVIVLPPASRRSLRTRP
jgi:chaperonin GroEL